MKKPVSAGLVVMNKVAAPKMKKPMRFKTAKILNKTGNFITVGVECKILPCNEKKNSDCSSNSLGSKNRDIFNSH